MTNFEREKIAKHEMKKGHEWKALHTRVDRETRGQVGWTIQSESEVVKCE